MTFAELTNLAQKLNLVYALNLDGGGSTTMVVREDCESPVGCSGGEESQRCVDRDAS